MNKLNQSQSCTDHMPDRFFVATVLSAAAYLLLTCVLADVPAGAYGQPRSPHLSADWAVPAWLTIVLTISVLLAGLSKRWPLVGVCVYLVLSYLFPVHQPYWIYTQWIGVRSIVAGLTFWGWYLHRRRWGTHFQWDLLTKLFSALVVWYAFTYVIAAVRYGNWSPPMQFHPRQLLDAFLLYLVVRNTDCRERALAAFGLTMVIVIVVRELVFQPSSTRDADMAMVLTMSIPMVLFMAAWWNRWWAWLICGSLGWGVSTRCIGSRTADPRLRCC